MLEESICFLSFLPLEGRTSLVGIPLFFSFCYQTNSVDDITVIPHPSCSWAAGICSHWRLRVETAMPGFSLVSKGSPSTTVYQSWASTLATQEAQFCWHNGVPLPLWLCTRLFILLLLCALDRLVFSALCKRMLVPSTPTAFISARSPPFTYLWALLLYLKELIVRGLCPQVGGALSCHLF